MTSGSKRLPVIDQQDAGCALLISFWPVVFPHRLNKFTFRLRSLRNLSGEE
jgi:hypothetical protein